MTGFVVAVLVIGVCLLGVTLVLEWIGKTG